MTRALFVTTLSTEVANHIQAWDSFNEPSVRVTHNPSGVPQDDEILRVAKKVRPQVIFYIGACGGFGIPSVQTFRALREFAPSVNLCSDAQDTPWHPVLDYYRSKECFDLQVSIDGAKNDHVDHSTITPIDPRPYEGEGPVKDILCGFSGSTGKGTRRGTIINSMKMRAILTHRVRSADSAYPDHVAFIRRCVSLLNVSFTGSGHGHHIKGRVLEAGWAKAALLECSDGPASDWLPVGSFIPYSIFDMDGLARLFTERNRLDDSAALLAETVRKLYTPQKIYGGILERLNVAAPLEKSAA